MKRVNILKGSRRLLLACMICAAMMSAGCGKKSEVPENQGVEQETEGVQADAGAAESEAAQAQTETEEEISGDVEVQVTEEEEETLTNDEGTVLLVVNSSSVQVTIPGNEEAEKAVNQFFADLQTSYGDTVTEYQDMAQEELAMREEEDLMDSWNGYELGREYTVMRADEQMISIVEISYEYTGGAHPNSVQVAYNFDTQTGARMTLEDVASDLDEIRTESVKYLGEMLPESEYAEELFDDYADHLEDILTDSTWYTDEKGFHIICNEYIITPHSAGILDFLLPYDQVDVVAEKYIPAQEDASSSDTDATDDQSVSQHSSED